MQQQFTQATIERVVKMQIKQSQIFHKKRENVLKATPQVRNSKLQAYNMQTAAKMLGIGPNKLFKLLRQKHIFETNVHNTPYQRYIAAGYFVTTLKSRMQIGVGQVFYAKTKVTNKGIIWLKNKLQFWGEKNV